MIGDDIRIRIVITGITIPPSLDFLPRSSKVDAGVEQQVHPEVRSCTNPVSVLHNTE
jgi:hypothetical protein